MEAGGHSTHVFPSPNFFGCFSKLESSSPCHIFSVQGEPHFYINCVLRPENFEFLESLHKTTKAKGLRGRVSIQIPHKWPQWKTGTTQLWQFINKIRGFYDWKLLGWPNFSPNYSGSPPEFFEILENMDGNLRQGGYKIVITYCILNKLPLGKWGLHRRDNIFYRGGHFWYPGGKCFG